MGYAKVVYRGLARNMNLYRVEGNEVVELEQLMQIGENQFDLQDYEPTAYLDGGWQDISGNCPLQPGLVQGGSSGENRYSG